MPNWMKMIEAKTALAKRGAKPSRAGDNPRIPPGQKQVHDFPVLDIGLEPQVSPSSWNLRVFGLVDQELDFSWKTFNDLPQIELTTDFHCVTRWSQLDMNWRGVSARKVCAPRATWMRHEPFADRTSSKPLMAKGCHLTLDKSTRTFIDDQKLRLALKSGA